MSYEHFGNLLQELRIKYHMSREKLAQNICTPKQIYRIEKGDSEPSIYLLHQLSIKFNLDLNEYYKMHFTCNTIIGLEGIKSINSALEHNDIPLLNSLIEKYEKLKDFKKGENLQHIYYGKALCSALLDDDYKTSLEYCYKGIQIECPEFNINKVTINMYSNVGFSILNCASQNLFAMNQYNNGMKVLTELLTVLENFVIDSPYPFFHSSQFSKKIYQVILYNTGVHLFEHGEIKKALNYIEKGIEYSLKEYNIRHLPALLFMKFKILYAEQKYEEAKEYYNQSFCLYKITNNKTVLAELETLSKLDYPEIFKE
ncbi:helix-turn-helix transcriptional regulator [Anaerocolumna sp. MB42-C2]|uniref:helix-turn-helix transcriptional regulator n=1 Tax=Anaerocolumna sp. MB42-C2 TaxID=3070997 RepID=UPI0027E16879|nr:helix-turn-helix transcriptional regulator [Anaerocolumna sp. MB42-C2]WMJ90483.1 helix-turn-helix transcriptional regulator [Anaerocolumna sp. MB42-C2]